MRAKMNTLCSWQVIAVLLLVLAGNISVVGCAASPPHSYLMAYGNPYDSRIFVPGLRIEHNLFNHKYQRHEKEDLEADWQADTPLKFAGKD